MYKDELVVKIIFFLKDEWDPIKYVKRWTCCKNCFKDEWDLRLWIGLRQRQDRKRREAENKADDHLEHENGDRDDLEHEDGDHLEQEDGDRDDLEYEDGDRDVEDDKAGWQKENGSREWSSP